MRAEVVTIGTELLLGELVDTNSTYIAQQLASIGLDLHYKTTVGDNRGRIAEVLRVALARCDVVITTGGLGPTVDDVTREAVSDVTGRPLVLVPELEEFIAALFRRWGRRMTESNRRQAYVPEGATVIENPVGTAPAFAVEVGRGVIICLPGVPREMQHLMTTRVLPYLRERMGGRGEIIKSLTLRTCGAGESQVGDLIDDLMKSPNPTVGTAAHAGQTDVRITAKAATEQDADRLLADMEARVRARLGDVIYGVGKETVEEVVVRLLHKAGKQIAILETNTGGAVAERVRSAPGGPEVLVAAETASYPAAAPDGTGGQPWDSPDVAVAAAQDLRLRTGADLALAFVGSTEQGADFYSARQGVTRAALATESGVEHQVYPFGGTGELTQQWVGARGLDFVRRHLLGVRQL
ncbi:MAG: CinA family nicotinamide mononucleotide deamidase-related protein [Anaerolineae bacterium]